MSKIERFDFLASLRNNFGRIRTSRSTEDLRDFLLSSSEEFSETEKKDEFQKILETLVELSISVT